MATYTRAGSFSGTVPGAPRETALRVLDASGADAVLWATADMQKTVGPIVYANEAGNVTFYAAPGTYTVRWTGGSATVAVTGGTEEAPAGSEAALGTMFDLLTTGEEVIPRGMVSDEYPLDSGTCFFSYFTARKTEAITHVETSVYGTAATSLTVARIGIYQSSGGTLTLLAASANDAAALWSATFTTYSKTLTSTFHKVAGNRYALCLLAVGSTMPVLGTQLERFQDAARAPRLEGDLTGQTDLPATVAESGLAVGYRRFQGILLP